MDHTLEVRPSPDRTEPAVPVSVPPPAPPPAKRRRLWLSWLLALLILAGTIYLAYHLLTSRQTAQTGRAVPPQSVGAATIGTGNLDVVLTGLGSVTPLATVTVVSQINGQLQTVAFQEGQIVHKGDFLAQIDPRPYQAALEQAQGTLAHDQGLLEQAKADNVRYQTLNKQDSIAKQTAQDQLYIIKQYEGTVIADQGTVDTDKLNLIYCHITSPIDGRVGIRLVDPGNYVQTSQTSGLFVLTQEQPMSVIFTLPEDDVAQIRTQMKAGTLAVDAYDRTNTTKIASGTLATIDNEIDSTTGTIKLRAMFDNKDEALFPQSFVNARLVVQTLKDVVVAPQAAVQNGAPGEFVYLVKPDGTVAVQPVKVGVVEGTQVQITDGLKAGDKVVTDGLDRLKDGAKINIVTLDGKPTQPPAQAPQGSGNERRRRGNGSGQRGAGGDSNGG
jgi:multidrug efflux system membrane fusion protein